MKFINGSIKKEKKHYYNHLIFVICIFFFTFSLYCFYLLEPNIDQIRQISWAQELNDSEYFVNFKNISDFKVFFLDRKSFLINLFRTAYSDIGHLFNILPILILYILNFTKIFNVYLFNTFSILFFTLNIYLTYLISKIYLSIFFKKEKIYFHIIFKISLVNFYTFFYSPLGFHNFSLFFYLLLFYYLTSNFFLKKRLSTLKIFIITVIGIFSHKINIILSISLVLLFLIVKKEIKSLTKYLFYIFLIIFPLFLIYLLFPKILSSTIIFAQINWSFNIIFNNFYIWLTKVTETSGGANLLFFIFGVYYLKKINKNYQILLIPIFVHLLASIFINSFNIYYLRTFLYITPFISIISFYGFYNLYLKVNYKFIKKTLLFIFIFNISWNYYLIYKNSFNYEKNTEIINEYFKYNGNIKSSLIDLDKIIKNNKIIFYNNLSEDYFKIYQYKLYKNHSFNIRPLSNLNKNNYFIENKNLINETIILISISDTEPEITKNFATAKENTSYFKKCELNNHSIYKKDNLINGKYTLFIHKIYCEM
jgi:hypothetical protein